MEIIITEGKATEAFSEVLLHISRCIRCQAGAEILGVLLLAGFAGFAHAKHRTTVTRFCVSRSLQAFTLRIFGWPIVHRSAINTAPLQRHTALHDAVSEWASCPRHWSRLALGYTLPTLDLQIDCTLRSRVTTGRLCPGSSNEQDKQEDYCRTRRHGGASINRREEDAGPLLSMLNSIIYTYIYIHIHAYIHIFIFRRRAIIKAISVSLKRACALKCCTLSLHCWHDPKTCVKPYKSLNPKPLNPYKLSTALNPRAFTLKPCTLTLNPIMSL